METTTIHDFIVQQEAAYKLPIPLGKSWSWSMLQHIDTSFLYKNSQLIRGKDDFTPVKNITRPILNLQYRAEGFDVKDITHFVDDKDDYYKSFLVKKFYEKWARENAIDTVIDQMVESYVDFGGALMKEVNDVKPEVVPLQSIAFCDQTDILSGPIGIKHYFAPDQLQDMESAGWGNPKNGATASIDEAIHLAREEKKSETNTQIAKTPGKYIEIYEVHGVMPIRYMDRNSTSNKYVRQLFIGCFYTKLNGEKGFVTLFHMPENKSPFKFVKRDPVHGRALGFGGAEELFEAQVWVNYDMIRMQGMLDAASKTILKSTGMNSATIASKNNLKSLENLSIVDVGMDSDLQQVDTFPRNLKLFENSVATWEQHAQQMGAANDSIMGEAPSSGTPFKLQELVTAESHSLHEYRKGKLATFWDEVERDWIIPHIAKELTKGTEFLADLDLDELREVSQAIKTNMVNDMVKEKILTGQDVNPDMTKAFGDLITEEFRKKGSKHFIEIFKGEMKDLPIDVRTNIAGKQKNLAATVDRIVNVFRFAFSNPQGFAQVMQIPGMASSFNQILEFSGLSPVDFGGIDKMANPPQQPQQPQPSQGQPSPLNALAAPQPQNA